MAFSILYQVPSVLLLGQAGSSYVITDRFCSSPPYDRALTSMGVGLLPKFATALLEGGLGLVRYRPVRVTCQLRSASSIHACHLFWDYCWSIIRVYS